MAFVIYLSSLKRRVENVRDVLNEGDQVLVKVIGIERDGKIRLSRKDALGSKPSRYWRIARLRKFYK